MPTFVDTSFLLALVLADDEYHERAAAWQRTIAGDLITTEYVLVELGDALATETLRGLAVELITLLRADANVQIVPASTTLMDEGLALFRARTDKGWGLTDCISFVTMQRNGVHDALTSDHHFEQAGFRALLREAPPCG